MSHHHDGRVQVVAALQAVPGHMQCMGSGLDMPILCDVHRENKTRYLCSLSTVLVLNVRAFLLINSQEIDHTCFDR